LRRWRAGWGYPTTLLCIYGFFSTVKPLVPFIYPYLTGPNLMVEQCINFFITWAMMLLVHEVAAFKAMQFFYGTKSACEVAYFSYIYSIVDLKHYRKATSYCRSVQLLGFKVGSVLGQLLVCFNLMSCNILVLTLGMISIALVTSLFLPVPQRSMFFHQSQSEPPQTPEGGDRWLGAAAKFSCCCWRDFLQCYSTRALLYWSVGWVLATCGYNEAINYVQVLWEHIQPSQKVTIYNGGMEAVSNLFGAATAYGMCFIQVDWAQWGELFLGSFSGLEALSYLPCEFVNYSLIYGANNFGSLVLQTIITSIVVDGMGLSLGIIPQFTIYGSYLSAIAVIFFLSGVYMIMRGRQSHRDSTTAEEPPSPTLCTPLQALTCSGPKRRTQSRSVFI
uniref:Solute carrier family 19 member 3 n=1 Tax=Hucho hucho TaxID=62062 RepID=A0A4W5KA78_9TELE